MSTVFRLDSSIRNEGSVTRAVASTLESALVEELGGATVVHREIGLTPLPSTAWGLSVAANSTPVDERTAEQRDASALASALADELERADAFILSAPFYNYGVSQHFKAWVDIVSTDPRFMAPTQTLEGRPAFLVVARGGGYSPGTPREGWDHATSWLLRTLSDVWALDVQLIESELTLADVNPAMADLRELAAQNLRTAHDDASRHGKRLGQLLSTNA